jgi:hypothetical protein
MLLPIVVWLQNIVSLGGPWILVLCIQPTGRAIQVEGGGGERRPSADIRRQRNRDSDAVIQVKLEIQIMVDMFWKIVNF